MFETHVGSKAYGGGRRDFVEYKLGKSEKFLEQWDDKEVAGLIQAYKPFFDRKLPIGDLHGGNLGIIPNSYTFFFFDA
jgi:hypothetical protein